MLKPVRSATQSRRNAPDYHRNGVFCASVSCGHRRKWPFEFVALRSDVYTGPFEGRKKKGGPPHIRHAFREIERN